MHSTMQDFPLTVTSLLRHGLALYGGSEVVTCTTDGARRASFAEVGRRTAQLAAALDRLGVQPGDRVATAQWNNQEHLEAYLAVPAMGAVLHTVNIRLFPEQIVYIANHAEDKVVIVDGSLTPLLVRLLPELKTIEHVVIVGPGELDGAHARVHSYEDLLAAESGQFAWVEDMDERSAALMCYTSGTTGNPKGVVYSHRSVYLHSMAIAMGNGVGLAETDRVLPVVPMFHVNAWGLPHAAWFSGADQLMPDRFLAAEPLARFIAAERPTISGAVPTVWGDLLRHADAHDVDLSSLRVVPCGGAAVPLSLMQAYQQRHGVTVIQGWGMTETSPVAALARPPKGSPPEQEWVWRDKTGRILAGVECRIVDEIGRVLPADGKAVGEFEVRGPWVTGSYYRGDDPSRFHDGWLRTGDVGTLDQLGYMKISDRTKDVIKSGGEWISSVDLENALIAHPDIVEAAVVAVPDDRWQERPLASVVLRAGASVQPEQLREFLAGYFARWQLPERWAFVDELPKTSVGKFDKKVLRARYAEGKLDATHVKD